MENIIIASSLVAIITALGVATVAMFPSSKKIHRSDSVEADQNPSQ